MNDFPKQHVSVGGMGMLKWFSMIVAIFVMARADAQTVEEGFKETFRNLEEINPALTIDSKWKKADGMLTSSAGGEMPQIYIKNLEVENVSIAFTSKVVRGNETNTHFGVYFDVDGNRIIQPYTFLNRFNVLETELGENVQHITIANYSKTVAVGEKSPFITFKITMVQGEGEVSRDGEVIGRFVTRPGIVNRIRLYTWGGDIAIKEIEFRELPSLAKGKTK